MLLMYYKSMKTEMMSFRLPIPLKKVLRREAFKDGRSANGLLVWIVRQYFINKGVLAPIDGGAFLPLKPRKKKGRKNGNPTK